MIPVIVYGVVNNINQKMYVGQTSRTLDIRRSAHLGSKKDRRFRTDQEKEENVLVLRLGYIQRDQNSICQSQPKDDGHHH